MKLIEKLKRLSPVPVEFVDEIANPIFTGVYYNDTNITGKPRIEILNSLEEHDKIAVLVHEIAHAQCDAKNCRCMKNPDHTKREIHANKFVLSWLLKHKKRQMLEREMQFMTKQANGISNYEHYIKAAEHIMKLKLWQKCLDYVK